MRKGLQNKDWIQIRKHGKILKYIVPQKNNVKDKKERDQNIDVKPYMKLKQIMKSLIRFTKKSLRNSRIIVGYKSPFAQIPKIQD